MDSTATVLPTTRGGSWHPDTDLENFSNTELNSRAQDARDTLQWIEAELQRRYSMTHSVNDWEKRFQSCLRYIKSHGRLDKKAARCVELAVSILSNELTGRREKDYRDFLNDVLRQCGPGLALLCAASFGKYNIAEMNKQNRTNLIDYVKSKQAAFGCPQLDSMVIQYGVPPGIEAESVGMLQNQSYTAGDLQTEAMMTQQASMEQTSTPTTLFVFSKAPISQIPLLPEPLLSAVQTSHTWNMERTYAMPTTKCIAVKMPKDVTSDVLITFCVGAEPGWNLIDIFMLMLEGP